jgi:SAM-dependent methyltransferase
MNSSSPPFWERFSAGLARAEAGVGERPGAYKGHSPAALYTSKEDLDVLLRHPLVRGTFADLGCGAGATVLFYAWLYPERRAVGVEFDPARVAFARELRRDLGVRNAEVIEADLLTADLPEADVYFLYFPTGPVLDRILEELHQRGQAFRLVAIESHGDLLPRLDLEPFLELSAEVPLAAPRHYPKARIYERRFVPRGPALAPFTLSFRDRYLVIAEGSDRWVGETRGLCWTADDRFELAVPPRTIRWRDVETVCDAGAFSPDVRRCLELRARGPVVIATRHREHRGELRKILLSPVFRLELSTGERVEWEHVITITPEA